MADGPRFPRRTVLQAGVTSLTVRVGGCATNPERTQTSGESLSIEVPSATPVGKSLPIVVSGLGPEATVEVAVQPTDSTLESYQWRRKQTANSDGRLETFAGSADGEPEPRMVLANLTSTNGEDSDRFQLRGREVIELGVRIQRGGTTLTEATTKRVARGPDSRGHTIEATDLVGTAYTPPGEGAHPPVIVLHGSAGVVPHEYCHMLATHGYWTLGLQYFGDEEQLPDDLTEIPMEYFERAVEWAQSRPKTTEDGIGLIGFSRGVEPALLTAASIDTPATVVGYSGSGIYIQASDRTTPVPWTRGGDPIASLEQIDTFWTVLQNAECGYWRNCSFDDPGKACDAVACTLEHVRTHDQEAYDAVTVPVEEIDGPVCLLTGKDDSVWDASVYSEMALHRLIRNDHDDAVGHYSYPDAGHVFLRPYYPNLLRGGTRDGNARASIRSWVRMLDTLRTGLNRKTKISTQFD